MCKTIQQIRTIIIIFKSSCNLIAVLLQENSNYNIQYNIGNAYAEFSAKAVLSEMCILLFLHFEKFAMHIYTSSHVEILAFMYLTHLHFLLEPNSSQFLRTIYMRLAWTAIPPWDSQIFLIVFLSKCKRNYNVTKKQQFFSYSTYFTSWVWVMFFYYYSVILNYFS